MKSKLIILIAISFTVSGCINSTETTDTKLIEQNKETVGIKTGSVAFFGGDGTLWVLDEDNYIFVAHGKVTWWGNHKDWNEHCIGDKKHDSPRDVEKAPNLGDAFNYKEIENMSKGNTP